MTAKTQLCPVYFQGNGLGIPWTDVGSAQTTSTNPCNYLLTFQLSTQDVEADVRSRSNRKIKFQQLLYCYVTQWPADDRPLVETCSHVIYPNKNQ